MRNPVFPAFCALAMVLVLLPLPWHWKARNTGTLLYIGWTFIGCLNFFVNSLVWAGNLSNPAPVWCDISTKIIVGQSVGITAASLCIHRRLYNIATIQNVSVSRNTKRRNVIIDLCIGLGLPVLVMVLHYVVQGHRYDIFEDVGCWPNVYITLLAIPMIYIWPIIIGVAAFIYCTLTIRAFLETRRQFSQILSSSHSGLSMSRYFRLMALAATEILFTLPFAIYLLVVNFNDPTRINAWISWADTHQNFSRVDFIPWVIIENRTDFAVNLWALPAGGILFFIYFGMAGEASAEYSKWFWAVAGRFGFKKPAKTVKTSRWSNKLASNASSGREVVTFPSRPTFDATQSSTSEPKKDTESKTEIESRTDIESLHTPTALEFSKPGDLEAQRPELK